MSTPLYDSFSAHYDRFVNWDQRLARELPFIERQLAAVGARSLVDAACGTGGHAIELARTGYDVVATDVSQGMIEQARANAAHLERTASFVVAGLGTLAPTLNRRFDAALCLGNSLPHLLTVEALAATLHDFRSVLRPGGLLLIQSRNFDRVMRDEFDRWLEPQSYSEGNSEWLFVRFYDLGQDGNLTFNVLTIQRTGSGTWSQKVGSVQLRPWQSDDLEDMIRASGFDDLARYGDLIGSAYDPLASEDLIITARRA